VERCQNVCVCVCVCVCVGLCLYVHCGGLYERAAVETTQQTTVVYAAVAARSIPQHTVYRCCGLGPTYRIFLTIAVFTSVALEPIHLHAWLAMTIATN